MEALALDASILRRDLPNGVGAGLAAASLLGRAFPAKRSRVGFATVQALKAQDTQVDLRDVESTAKPGRVIDLQLSLSANTLAPAGGMIPKSAVGRYAIAYMLRTDHRYAINADVRHFVGCSGDVLFFHGVRGLWERETARLSTPEIQHDGRQRWLRKVLIPNPQSAHARRRLLLQFSLERKVRQEPTAAFLTCKWAGLIRYPPVHLEGRQSVRLHCHWSVRCRPTLSEHGALLVRASWYAREVQRGATDH
jgi:hypothetical protein